MSAESSMIVKVSRSVIRSQFAIFLFDLKGGNLPHFWQEVGIASEKHEQSETREQFFYTKLQVTLRKTPLIARVRSGIIYR